VKGWNLTWPAKAKNSFKIKAESKCSGVSFSFQWKFASASPALPTGTGTPKSTNNKQISFAKKELVGGYTHMYEAIVTANGTSKTETYNFVLTKGQIKAQLNKGNTTASANKDFTVSARKSYDEDSDST
jgi:hypothetical protein